MNTHFKVRCDCCGLMVRPANRDDCPRCDYPVALEKEAQFLSDNIRSLQRVATYGGASLPVTALIARYQQRQNYLLGLRAQKITPSVTPTMPEQQQGSIANILDTAETHSTVYTNPVAAVENPITPFPVAPEKLPTSQQPAQLSLQVPPVEVIPPVVPHTATRTFSLKAFFADQTINIVSSLGAFLILIGSLSFVVTTPNLGLSFLTLLVVHALFGIMGAVTRRFQSFRIVSVIYTAIFALQVPLVGLAGYRLVSGALISTPALVAMAATYAAIVYSALAIYQRFQPFAYLAAVSITVVDIALAITFHLAYVWWSSTLMLLALASLVCVSPSTEEASTVQKPWNILLQPVQILMKAYVYISYAYVLLAWLITLTTNSASQPFIEARFSIACTLLLLFCWTCLFAWRSRLGKVLLQLPYVFLACILAFAHAYSFAPSSYVIVLTGTALLYHCIERFAHTSIQRVQTLRGHIEFLILACVSAIPLIVDTDLPFKVSAKAYGLSLWSMVFPPEIFIDIVALLCGVVLTGSIIISHTGWQKSPSQGTAKWCWLLLLSGALFYWGYNLIGLTLPVVPVWSMLALTGILLLTTIAVRRFTSAAWADPLDTLTLVLATQTLLLSIPQGHVVHLSLLLTFTSITYAMVLYQHRISIFMLTYIFALLTCIPLFDDPTTLLIICIILPLVWSILERFLPSYQQFTDNSHALTGSPWTLPVLLTSALYTLDFLSTEAHRSVSTLELWLQIPLPIALELVLLACIWYSTAIMARKKIGLVAASGLACLALFFPTSTAPLLTGIAFGSILLAVLISRLVGRDWGIPLYVVGLLAAILIGFNGLLLGITQPFYGAIPYALLAYAIVVYGVLLLEKYPQGLSLTAGFAIWGICLLPLSASYHKESWTIPFIVALLTVITLITGLLGLCIGRFSGSPQTSIQGPAPTNALYTRFRWNWPWYLVSLVSLTITLAWSTAVSSTLPAHVLTVVLALFLGFAFILMIAERLPDLTLLVIALAVWLIAQTGWATWQMVCAYSLLCLLVFAGQLLWRRIPPVLELVSLISFARVGSLSGLGMVILFVFTQGGLSPHAGLLAQSGVFTLCIAAIVLWAEASPTLTARLQPSSENKISRYVYYYSAGLLLSLTIPWELLAFGQTDVTWLTLVPASYMIITSPFLLHDRQWSHLRWMGHSLALCGAVLLLLPTLWSSFDHEEVFPTLLLAAESLLLFLLGAGMRIRFFVLSGAALIIVSAIHLLFLPALGIPTFLALTLSGTVLLALATVLLVVRTRLAAVWRELN